MGRLFLQKLDGPCYACEHCGCHLAKASDLMSRVRLPRDSKRGRLGLPSVAWCRSPARPRGRAGVVVSPAGARGCPVQLGCPQPRRKTDAERPGHWLHCTARLPSSRLVMHCGGASVLAQATASSTQAPRC